VSSPESGQISSFRAIRRAIPSSSLRELIRSAGKLFTEEGLDEVVSSDVEPMVFAANGLHSTLLVIRAPADIKNNKQLEKIETYIRSDWHPSIRSRRAWPGAPKSSNIVRRKNPLGPALQAVEDEYVMDKDQLYVRASKIVPSSTADMGHAGRELSLLIDDGPVAHVLNAQSGLLNEAASGTNAASLLPEQAKPNPLELPFMRAVFRSEVQLSEFIEALNSELPVYDVGLQPMPISYRHEFVG
jgi:hypothetical protein